MAWVRMDDKFTTGPKVKRAAMFLGGKRPRRRVISVWAEAMSYCNRHLTNGLFPHFEMSLIDDEDPSKVFLAMAQGDADLGPMVVQEPSGWRFRHYDEYQMTKEEIEAQQQHTALRQKRYRERKRNGVTQTSGHVTSRTTEPDRTEPDRTVCVDTHADAPKCEPIHAPEPLPVVKLSHPRRNFAPSIVQSQKAHMAHAWCSGTVPCVPQFVHDELRKAIGPKASPNPTSALIAFYAATEAAHDGSTIGSDPPGFWRSEWRKRYGAPANTGRMSNGDSTLAAARKVAAEFDAQENRS